MYGFRVRQKAEAIAAAIYGCGGVQVMTGEEWRSIVGLERLTGKASSYVRAVFEDAGLRTIGRPRNQGDIVVVYHPRTHAGRNLDRELGRPMLEVTEPWWAPIHRRQLTRR